MRCREADLQLPAFADEAPEGDLAAHLATCARCRGELDRYRALVGTLGVLKEEELEPSPGYLGRMLVLVPPPSVLQKVRVLAHARPVRYALVSLGGAAVGATAIGLVWWRVGRRTREPSLAA